MANNDSSLCSVLLVLCNIEAGEAKIKELIKWIGAGLTSCWWQSDPGLACHMTPRWCVCSHGNRKPIAPINIIGKTNTAAGIHHPPVKKHSSITIYCTVDLFQNSSVSFPGLSALREGDRLSVTVRHLGQTDKSRATRKSVWLQRMTSSSERSNHRSAMSGC